MRIEDSGGYVGSRQHSTLRGSITYDAWETRGSEAFFWIGFMCLVLLGRLP
jgi:hypothetical protein